jgi:glycosyltransferase involved in cell wall biosynthesis
MTRSKKKLLFVIPRLVIGGAERLTIYLLKYMDRKKFDVALCLLEEKGELLNEIPKDIEIFNLHKSNRWSFLSLLKRFNDLVVAYRPDLIYTRMWYATSLAIFSRMLYSHHIPICANEEHNHKRDILKTDTFGFLKKKFMDIGHRKAELVIVPSGGVKRELINSYSLRPEKVRVIYNSVDIDFVKSYIHSQSEDPTRVQMPVVVAFGRLISRKGFDDLLKAFRIVRDKMKSRLIIIGDGEEHNNLQNLSYSLSLEDDVTLTGYLDNPYEILSSADVFVLSSRWEGFGNVIIEAMACGVPVISTDCPYGPNEIITHGVNGLLVPVGDVQAMAEAIVTLLRDRALRTSLAEAGRKRAQDFSVDKMVAEYEKVFERVAS